MRAVLARDTSSAGLALFVLDTRAGLERYVDISLRRASSLIQRTPRRPSDSRRFLFRPCLVLNKSPIYKLGDLKPMTYKLGMFDC